MNVDDVWPRAARASAAVDGVAQHDAGQHLVAAHRVRHGGHRRRLRRADAAAARSRPPPPRCSRRCGGSRSSCGRRSEGRRPRRAARRRRCGTSRRPRLPRGGFVLQVAGEEAAPRVGRRRGAPAVRRARPTRDVRARVVDDAILDVGRCAAEAAVPTWRGSRLAMTTAPAPVSVIAQASSSGNPKRASNGACSLRSTPAPKPKRTLCSRSCVDRSAPPAASPASRRGSARWWRRDSRTLAHQRRRMEAVERNQAAAGQQHRHGRVRHGVHVTHRQRRDHALRAGAHRAQAADARRTSCRHAGNSRSAARSPSGGRWCRRCRAARIRCRHPPIACGERCGESALARRLRQIRRRDHRIAMRCARCLRRSSASWRAAGATASSDFRVRR